MYLEGAGLLLKKNPEARSQKGVWNLGKLIICYLLDSGFWILASGF